MNHCRIQRNTFSACEEMRSSASVTIALSDSREEFMVCPKPRRLSLFSGTMNDPIRPQRRQMSNLPDPCDSKAGPELLDVILSKGGFGAELTCGYIALSPPFFSGSPPSRVSNPLIQDARFGDEKINPISPPAIPVPSGTSSSSPSSSSSSSSRKGGRVRANFGNNPAVRIEGFDCLDRDNRRNCSIPALA